MRERPEKEGRGTSRREEYEGKGHATDLILAGARIGQSRKKYMIKKIVNHYAGTQRFLSDFFVLSNFLEI